MKDTSTTYLGVKIPNPVIIGSSSLTGTAEAVQKAAASGAGAIVLKSLFEEQISADLENNRTENDFYQHPEAAEYLEGLARHLGPRDYLQLIERSKALVDIPVFASINCVSHKWWGEYGKQLSESGADGVELNVSIMPRSSTQNSQAIEDYLVSMIEEAAGALTLPFSVKLGPYFTALPQLVNRIARAGAKSVLLFNRFYRFDIDIEKKKISSGPRFSTAQDYHEVLRWMSILYEKGGIELGGTTGIHEPSTLIKMLLAGASSVQIASVAFKQGFGVVRSMTSGLETWMDKQGYDSVSDFIGLLSQSESDQPELYERLQYIKALTQIE